MASNQASGSSDPVSFANNEPYYMRITGHGQIRTMVTFALQFFKEYPNRPLVLHTLPLVAVPGYVPPTVPSAPQEVGSLAAKPPPATAPPKVSTDTIPKLISVAEIIKREYLKSCNTRSTGLHQYNQVGVLEDLSYDRVTSLEIDQTPEELEQQTEEIRRSELAKVLQGKRHLRIKKTPYMKITLSCQEIADTEVTGATYQTAVSKTLTKSMRARMNKRRRKQETAQKEQDA